MKNKKLGNDNFLPYIKPEEKVGEFTVRAVVLGSVLAIVFGLANAYLGLKVGMTVSASIPAAVISMAILKGALKRGTILENNIAQTIGSSGESLAAGVIFTIPAFFMWNYFPDSWTIILISILGGFLGILFMIPLRRYLIVQEHRNLPYPEGTACAEILKAGDKGGAKAGIVFTGVGIGAIYKFLMSGLKLWKETASWLVTGIKGMELGIDLTPALLGVGFIIGPQIASYMLSGAILGYLVLSPLIAFIGSGLTTPIPPADKIVSMLSPGEIRSFYIRYIGAGAVAVGGLISLLRASPIVFRCFKLGFQEMFKGFKFLPDKSVSRTDADIPMSLVIAGAIFIAILMLLIPQTHIGLIGMFVVVLFSFFFVTVASRIVGIVGSSSSPVSGMTIATLLITCLVFIALNWRGVPGMIGAMSIGSVVCIAICMAGDASQDLKTGFLVGATPYYQQIAEFVGVIIPALFMGGVLMLLHKTMVIGSDKLPAPQATLMSFVVKGVLTGTLPWTFVGLGAILAIGVELLGISALPFAIGLYLPLSLSLPMMVGAIVYEIVKRTAAGDSLKVREERGILFSSGLVAGDALIGVLIAFLIGIPALNRIYESLPVCIGLGNFANLGSLIIFLTIALVLWLKTKPTSTP
uniref:Oligopeptide transporter, OPT family n=1 Tax=candidate division WOR-3 bacterium TaxID=2052148 RepID=A0A7C4XJS8_UNCW3